MMGRKFAEWPQEAVNPKHSASSDITFLALNVETPVMT